MELDEDAADDETEDAELPAALATELLARLNALELATLVLLDEATEAALLEADDEAAAVLPPPPPQADKASVSIRRLPTAAFRIPDSKYITPLLVFYAAQLKHKRNPIRGWGCVRTDCSCLLFDLEIVNPETCTLGAVPAIQLNIG